MKDKNELIKAEVLISTGTFENIKCEVFIDTKNIEDSKNVIRALHRHFHGLFVDDALKKD